MFNNSTTNIATFDVIFGYLKSMYDNPTINIAIFLVVFGYMLRFFYKEKVAKGVASFFLLFAFLLLPGAYYLLLHRHFNPFLESLNIRDHEVYWGFFIVIIASPLTLFLGTRIIHKIDLRLALIRIKAGNFNKEGYSFSNDTRKRIERIKRKVSTGELDKINKRLREGLTADLNRELSKSYNLKKILQLIEEGADLKAAMVDDKKPLMVVKPQFWKIPLALLELGEDVNERGGYDQGTPLMYAAESGPSMLIHALLRAGADPQARDSDGKTALMYYAQKTYFDYTFYEEEKIFQTLIKISDINAQDNDGKTALMYAVENADQGSSSTAKFMIKNRADLDIDLDIMDNEGKTALDIAYTCANKEMIKILQEAGAKEGDPSKAVKPDEEESIEDDEEDVVDIEIDGMLE